MVSSSAAVVAVLVVVLLRMGWPAAAVTAACEDCPTNCSSTCSHNIKSQASSDYWLACAGHVLLLILISCICVFEFCI
ncbi:hypothetical protein ZWY2020_015332 [Hordeum vulgare]|nr:hypothetical protein ZWY2020_015332 [Hordeum vulgare]